MTVGRVFGYFVSFLGTIFFIFVLYVCFVFFYVHERVLFIFPQLAERVTLNELANNAEKHDGRWIRIRGEVWLGTESDAYLAPVGSSAESAALENKAEYESDKYGNDSEGNASERLKARQRFLPHYSIYIHHFSAVRLRTVSVLDIEPGIPVEFVGEFELHKKNLGPHIDLVAALEPRQNQYWLPILFMIGLLVSGISIFVICFLWGAKIRKRFSSLRRI